MYAEKIFSVKLSTSTVSGYFPFQENTLFSTFIQLKRNKLSITSIPPKFEDMVLINYHDIIDRIYDLADFIESIKCNAPKAPRTSYKTSIIYTKNIPSINIANRLRKLNYIAYDFFNDYKDAINYLDSIIKSKNISNCDYYTRSIIVPVNTILPKYKTTFDVPLDKSSKIIMYSNERVVSFRVNGLPLNACAFYSAFFDAIPEYFRLFKHMFRPQLSEWKYRMLSNAIRHFDFNQIPRPSANTKLFYKPIQTKLNVYFIHEHYDEKKEFDEILQKKNFVFNEIK